MKFWNWVSNEKKENEEPSADFNTLRISGPIASEEWWGDEVTPQMFRDELDQRSGDITIWIDSPGGDVFAAAQIYNIIKEYKGGVSVKIDSLAASAASVIAMAGDTVEMSPVGMLMIHNPMTIAMGNIQDFEETIRILKEIRESIINAYAGQTGLSRTKLINLMDGEAGEGTWMSAKKALDLGFIDGILYSEGEAPTAEPESESAEESSAEEKETSIDERAIKARYAETAQKFAASARRALDAKLVCKTGCNAAYGESHAADAVPQSDGFRAILDGQGMTSDGAVPYIILLDKLNMLQ